MKVLLSLVISFFILIIGCDVPIDNATKKVISESELKRDTYFSQSEQEDRNYFVYLPREYYSQPNMSWPILMFLHGNGERGNGKDELDYVLMHGPLYEAWIQKKDLPFIIVSPQLPMFDFDNKGIDYITNRSKKNIPVRLLKGVPHRPPAFLNELSIMRTPSLINMDRVAPLLPDGWEKVAPELITILDNVKKKYRVNQKKIYLSGLSYGGFGTWYMASKYPNRFAAIAPVVGWGHPSFMYSIAAQNLPVWQFSGGRDATVEIKYFYAGLDKLEQLGHENVRFTVHEDMGHDAWTRVYSSNELYDWLLSFELGESNATSTNE